MTKPIPCRCTAKPWPHRPMSVAGCEHDIKQMHEFWGRVFSRMDPDAARAIRVVGTTVAKL